MLFCAIFKNTIFALSTVFLISIIGAFLAKRDILARIAVKGLTNLLIDVCVPAFIFYKVIKNFDSATLFSYWQVLAWAVIMLAGGGILALLFIALDKNAIAHKKQFLAMNIFNNCGYLPISLVAVLFNPIMAEKLYLYIFVVMLVWNPLMWTIGVWLMGGPGLDKGKLKNILNPPLAAIILGYLFAITGIKPFMPDFFMRMLKLLGDCTVPLLMIVLGATLAQMPFDLTKFKRPIFYLVFGRLIILPGLALIIVAMLHLETTLAALIVLQASMPTAATLPIISLKIDKESNFVTQSVLTSYIISIFTIPLFYSLFTLIFP